MKSVDEETDQEEKDKAKPKALINEASGDDDDDDYADDQKQLDEVKPSEEEAK